jgi:hypothetical protein
MEVIALLFVGTTLMLLFAHANEALGVTERTDGAWDAPPSGGYRSLPTLRQIIPSPLKDVDGL